MASAPASAAAAAAAATPACLRPGRHFQCLQQRPYGGRKQQRALRRGNVAVAVAEGNKARVSADKDGNFTFSFGDDPPEMDSQLYVETTVANEAATVPLGGGLLQISHTAGGTEDAGDYKARHFVPSDPHRNGLLNISQGENIVAEASSSSGESADRNPDSSTAVKGSNGSLDSAQGSMSAIPIPVLAYRHGIPFTRSASTAVKQEPRNPLTRYRQACKHGNLLDALAAVEEACDTNDTAALASFIHKDFLRLAGKHQAVAEAFQFVQLLPHNVADRRTYNMLITVCAQAADLPGALKAASLLQSTGAKLDDTHYTNIMKAAAAAADADAAFKLYSEMRKEGIKPCVMTITTLIDACAREITQRIGYSKDRRAQLVLTDRAMKVFSDGLAMGLKADAPMWNALLNVAGYSGKLDQALGVMENMQINGIRPNDRTFSTLIAACKRAGQPEMGLKVFEQAMRQGVSDSLMVYFAAVDACTFTKEAPDIDAAMHVYKELKMNGVFPTTQFYSVMINIAGLAGQLDLALQLQDEMIAQGLDPDDSSYAAVINACVQNGDLEMAEQTYVKVRALGGGRFPHAFNTMVNAYAQAFNIGNAVMVLEDMAKAGVAPDRHTYGSLIKACQRCGEPDLAFLVYRLMRNQGFSLDEATAFTLIRACFNQIRSLWRPGGYPPTRDGSYRMSGTAPAAAALLKALNCPPQIITAWREKPDLPVEEWQKKALNTYREFISADHPFSMRMLDIVLGSLRQPLIQHSEEAAAQPGMRGLMPQSFGATAGRSSGLGVQYDVGSTQTGGSETKKIKTIEIQFDSRAISLIDEATTTGNLPQFSLDTEEHRLVNLRGLPPTVAEVFILAMFRSLERRATVRFRHRGELTILVPPYDPTVLFVPSYEPHVGDGDEDVPSSAIHTDGLDSISQMSSNPAVGLAVAAQLRRLKMYSYSAPADGSITVRGKEITRWVRSRIRTTMNENSALMVNGGTAMQPQQRSRGRLTDQQRQIRVDLG